MMGGDGWVQRRIAAAPAGDISRLKKKMLTWKVLNMNSQDYI